MTMTTPPSREVMLGFLWSADWDNVARYLRAGRQFADLTDEALDRTWALAWRTYYDEYRRDLWNWCMDAEGELRPERLVHPGMADRISARRRVHESYADAERRLREEVGCFMRECARAN